MKNKNTLLIVDDLEMNRAILGNIFKKNYDIVEACDGEEALKYIRENSKNIVAILLDLVMPKMNGIEVLRTLRREKIAEDVPIFIITVDNSEDVMYEAYELGVKDILEKPFVPYFLKKRIENVIELYKIKENQEKIIEEKLKGMKELNYKISELLSLSMNKNIENVKKSVEKLIEELKENQENSY